MTAPNRPITEDVLFPPPRGRMQPHGAWAMAALMLASVAVSAQTATALPAAARPAAVAAPSTAGPIWGELTAAQRDILQPLSSAWPSLSQSHKLKWLEMARSYRSLPPEEQAKMQGRMKEWVALSPQQRTQARLNFAKTKELSKELTADEKKAKWEAYQSLSAEEKRLLADKAPARPKGAAPVLKPVSRQKLATIPLAADQPKAKAAPKIVVSQPTNAPGLAPVATPAAPLLSTPALTQ